MPNVFKLNFEEFMVLNRRINGLEGLKQTDIIFPLFYYVAPSGDLYLFKPFNGVTFCTIIASGDIDDFEIFKREYFPRAYILTENYIETIPKVPQTEIPESNPNKQTEETLDKDDFSKTNTFSPSFTFSNAN